MAELKQHIADLAAKYTKAGFTLDEATKTAKPNSDVYGENLLEGLTPEIVQLVRENDTVHLAAAAKAGGEFSMAECVKNKDLNTVTTVVPMTGKDNMKFVYEHTKQVRDMKANDGTMIDKHGSIRAQFEMYGESGNRGQLAIVRDELAAAALEKASK